MSRTLTAQDRSALIRLASSLPKGSGERRAILAGLSSVAAYVSDKNLLRTLKRWNHPALTDAAGLQEWRNSAVTIFHEFEVRNPYDFKEYMERDMGQGQVLPIDFYAEVVKSMKKDDKDMWKSKE